MPRGNTEIGIEIKIDADAVSNNLKKLQGDFKRFNTEQMRAAAENSKLARQQSNERIQQLKNENARIQRNTKAQADAFRERIQQLRNLNDREQRQHQSRLERIRGKSARERDAAREQERRITNLANTENRIRLNAHQSEEKRRVNAHNAQERRRETAQQAEIQRQRDLNRHLQRLALEQRRHEQRLEREKIQAIRRERRERERATRVTSGGAGGLGFGGVAAGLSIGGIGSAAARLSPAVAGAAVALTTLTPAIRSVINVASDAEQLRVGLRAVTGSAREAARQLDDIRAIAREPGITFAEAARSGLRLRASGFDRETANNLIRELGNAAARSGAQFADVQEALRQLTQIASTQRFTAENLNIILERLPTLREAFIEEFGTTVGGDLQKVLERSGQTFEDAIQRLLQNLAEDERVSGETYANAVSNLQNAFRELQERIGQRLLPVATDIVKGLTTLVDGINRLSGVWDAGFKLLIGLIPGGSQLLQRYNEAQAQAQTGATAQARATNIQTAVAEIQEAPTRTSGREAARIQLSDIGVANAVGFAVGTGSAVTGYGLYAQQLRSGRYGSNRTRVIPPSQTTGNQFQERSLVSAQRRGLEQIRRIHYGYTGARNQQLNLFGNVSDDIARDTYFQSRPFLNRLYSAAPTARVLGGVGTGVSVISAAGIVADINEALAESRAIQSAIQSVGESSEELSQRKLPSGLTLLEKAEEATEDIRKFLEGYNRLREGLFPFTQYREGLPFGASIAESLAVGTSQRETVNVPNVISDPNLYTRIREGAQFTLETIQALRKQARDFLTEQDKDIGTVVSRLGKLNREYANTTSEINMLSSATEAARINQEELTRLRERRTAVERSLEIATPTLRAVREAGGDTTIPLRAVTELNQELDRLDARIARLTSPEEARRVNAERITALEKQRDTIRQNIQLAQDEIKVLRRAKEEVLEKLNAQIKENQILEQRAKIFQNLGLGIPAVTEPERIRRDLLSTVREPGLGPATPEGRVLYPRAVRPQELDRRRQVQEFTDTITSLDFSFRNFRQTITDGWDDFVRGARHAGREAREVIPDILISQAEADVARNVARRERREAAERSRQIYLDNFFGRRISTAVAGIGRTRRDISLSPLSEPAIDTGALQRRAEVQGYLRNLGDSAYQNFGEDILLNLIGIGGRNERGLRDALEDMKMQFRDVSAEINSDATISAQQRFEELRRLNADFQRDKRELERFYERDRERAHRDWIAQQLSDFARLLYQQARLRLAERGTNFLFNQAGRLFGGGGEGAGAGNVVSFFSRLFGQGGQAGASTAGTAAGTSGAGAAIGTAATAGVTLASIATAVYGLRDPVADIASSIGFHNLSNDMAQFNRARNASRRLTQQNNLRAYGEKSATDFINNVTEGITEGVLQAQSQGGGDASVDVPIDNNISLQIVVSDRVISAITERQTTMAKSGRIHNPFNANRRG